jgi:hypothetical protein
VNGATWTGNGKWNGGYSFDGNDDYINIPNNASLNTTNNEITIL